MTKGNWIRSDFETDPTEPNTLFSFLSTHRPERDNDDGAQSFGGLTTATRRHGDLDGENDGRKGGSDR